MTPQGALSALAGIRWTVEAVLEAEGDEAVADAVGALAEALQDLDLEQPSDAEDTEAWQRVADELHSLMAWMEEPAEADAKARFSREERIRIAVSAATRGRGRLGPRRRDAIDKILDGADAAVGFTLRTAWAGLKLAVRGLVAVTRVAARGAHAGAVHVREYMRNGDRVHAHDRGEPSKAAPGAHKLYR